MNKMKREMNYLPREWICFYICNRLDSLILYELDMTIYNNNNNNLRIELAEIQSLIDLSPIVKLVSFGNREIRNVSKFLKQFLPIVIRSNNGQSTHDSWNNSNSMKITYR